MPNSSQAEQDALKILRALHYDGKVSSFKPAKQAGLNIINLLLSTPNKEQHWEKVKEALSNISISK